MQTKEEKLLKEKIKSIAGIEKLNCKDIKDIIEELRRKALPRK
ncbi:hypothetical protein [uncultured Clostridium sp.]|nr:hypothetical protein [uncultured Clostridium sp.]